MNTVVIEGNIAYQPELVITRNNKSLVRFRLRNEQGEFSVVVWDRLAEGIISTAEKGTHVIVEGRITTNSVRNGQDVRTYVDIVASSASVFPPATPRQTDRDRRLDNWGQNGAPSSSEYDPLDFGEA